MSTEQPRPFSAAVDEYQGSQRSWSYLKPKGDEQQEPLKPRADEKQGTQGR